MNIRCACLSDAGAICHLNSRAFGYEFAPEATRRRLEVILNKTTDMIFIAEADGRVVGYAHAADYECTYSEALKNLLAIAVDESARERGAGRALMAAVEDWARESGAIGVRLVSGFNRVGAHKFYTALGYADRKDQKNFIKYF